ncbi:acetyl-CoA C-acyltransferase [Gulosibacter molinativorax]|uniref:Probable acetyl-CoA acetyltransferase n=1 Tax=Gulosibacter molinativorax TaxID=256821 RepID=A0ABT7C8B5_9MICO|nr:acetyl-CoA C-acyltransferase [Gulosibacter molinativorax]MDJ1371438.1 acetyl-CoA C-acyltransferase [Gulosibacter molinativorax]QUY62936.1 Acetyl-CoA C-acetyltransferase [Gulosibacter molinativorax]
MTTNVLIAGYARTPFTKFNGQLASQPATVLGAHAIRAALSRAGVAASDVDAVVAGQVLQGGAGQNPARQSSVGAGISFDVPAITLNAVCLSGTEAVSQAARLIRAGEADVVVAVGQESMSLAPHVIPLRAGVKYGSGELIDTVAHDGLTDAFDQVAMGELTEDGNAERSLTREEQDAFSAASHQHAAASSEFFGGEIEPFTVTSRRGDTVVAADDGIRADTTVESLGKLRAAFKKDGTITAGNASQITDGAAALVLVSEEAAERLGVKGIARVESTALVAGPDVQLHSQPARAISAALSKLNGVDASDLSVVEINEAFAAVGIHSQRELGIDAEIVNPHGGAIALGHPIGASGARIVGTLARQLAELGPDSLGAVGICGGGGQGSAVVLRAV